MPTIKFTACPAEDCKSISFYETTGRQPDVATGYAATTDETTYTGKIIVYDSLGAEIFSKDVTPSASQKPYLIVLEEEASTHSWGGFYRMRYEVYDASSALVGFAEGIFHLLCSLNCAVEDMARQLCKSCCKDKLAAPLNTYVEYISSALTLAQLNQLGQAQLHYLEACVAVEKAECNC